MNDEAGGKSGLYAPSRLCLKATQAGRSFEGRNQEDNYQEAAEEDPEASRDIRGIHCLMGR
jgi:hypothetical protein